MIQLKKIIAVSVCFLFLLSSINVVLGKVQGTVNLGDTIYVDDDNTQGPWDGSEDHPFQDIQDAIDVAISGENIYVQPGNYSQFTINKSISIIGSELYMPVIELNNKIRIISDNVNISNLKIKNNRNGSYLLVITNADNININSCEFSNENFAVDLDECKNIRFEDCDFLSIHYAGIILMYSDVKNVEIINCNFFDSQIRIVGSLAKEIHIVNCSFVQCGRGANPLGAIMASSRPENLVIENCIFEQNGWGIEFADVRNTIVRKCIFYDHSDYYYCKAINFLYSFNNIVYDNIFAYNAIGITVNNNCKNNTFFNNTFYQNDKSVGVGIPESTWYNEITKVGNYWDDYDGVDNNGDGIGDTPYMIAENVYDLYPKMVLDKQIKPLTPSPPIVDKNVLKKYQDAEFFCNVSDPNGDDIFYKFLWDDGTESDWLGPYNSGTICSAFKSWNKSGVYKVKVIAKDSYYDLPLTSNPTTIEVGIPNKPEITGPTKLTPGESYTYKITSTDPDGDQLYYIITWEWGEYTGWFGPYRSGETICFNHTWTETGRENIRFAAKDSDGAESDWNNLEIAVSKGKNKNIKLLSFDLVRELLEYFSFLQNIMEDFIV